MGALGWIAFGILLLLAIGIGVPGVINGTERGFQMVVHSPLVAQAVGAMHAMISSVAHGMG